MVDMTQLDDVQRLKLSEYLYVQESLNKIDIDRSEIRTGYIQAMTKLNEIEQMTNPTNAEAMEAIKAEARILRSLLKYIKAQVI